MLNAQTIYKGRLKSILTISFFLSGLLLVTSCKTAQLVPGTSGPTNITLRIKDAPALFAKPKYNRGIIKATCVMTDNRTNNMKEIDPYLIESIANIDKDVTWSVEITGPSSGDYEAKVLMIEEKKGSKKNFFGALILPPNGVGQVKKKANTEAKVGNHYTYKIFFSLAKGDKINYYAIDPKLKGNN